MSDMMKKKSGYKMTDKSEGMVATRMKAKKADTSTGAMKKAAMYEKGSKNKTRS
jgi:molybdate-binding protein